MRYHIFLSIFLLGISLHQAFGQDALTMPVKKSNVQSYEEKDLAGLFIRSSKKDHRVMTLADSLAERKKKQFSMIPAAGYSLQTGFAGILSANLAYYNGTSLDTKLSSISTSLTYSQYKQILWPLVANIWTKNNKYNFISDNRVIDYPSNIYGVGGRQDPNTGYQIAFKGVKLHQTLLKEVRNNLYLGVGYYFDRLWDIRVIDTVARRLLNNINRQLGNSEVASGYTLKLLFDNRLNQINPKKGWFINTVFRDNRQFLKSDNNWQSMLIDVRAYTPFPKYSNNTLAFWSYNWLTTYGVAPYLLIPSTGWDDQYNTGRGYIQGRFRGNQMFYFESEYRFNITRNGFFGGVLFGNVQYFSPDISKTYNVFSPGYGGGVRIKLNKHSGANLCIDYGFGKDGSKGFFVNLGEVF